MTIVRQQRINLLQGQYLGIALEDLNLFVSLLAELAPELGEGLELVDELVNNLPQPLVWQLQVNWLLGR